MTNLKLPFKYTNTPELNNEGAPPDGSVWNMLKLHRTDNGFIIYNPLSSIQFDIDYADLPQLKAGKIGIVRWDNLSVYLYDDPSYWYILAQLNNIIDPISEIPDRSDLLYYIKPDVIEEVFREIRNSS